MEPGSRKSLGKCEDFSLFHGKKQGHAAVSGPVDSMQSFKCIFFIL